jgi:hypothetical protein
LQITFKIFHKQAYKSYEKTHLAEGVQLFFFTHLWRSSRGKRRVAASILLCGPVTETIKSNDDI